MFSPEWINRVLESPDNGDKGLPSFPPTGTQNLFVGQSGRVALEEVVPFLGVISRHWDQSGSVLDFGVGWGRIARFFQVSAESNQMFLADIDPAAMHWCAVTGVKGARTKIEPDGQLPMPDGSISLAYAYSVFSHLSAASATHWLGDIARALKPGGLLVFTTQSAFFIDLVLACKNQPEPNDTEKQIGAYIADPAQAMIDFRAGEHVFSPTGGGGMLDGSFYGWAAIPQEWIARNFSAFQLVEYIDSSKVGEQATIVLRRV